MNVMILTVLNDLFGVSVCLPIFLFGSTKPNWQPRETCYLFDTEIHHLHPITVSTFISCSDRYFCKGPKCWPRCYFSPTDLCISMEVFEIILTAIQELCSDMTWANNSISYCSCCCSHVCFNSSWVFVWWLKLDATKNVTNCVRSWFAGWREVDIVPSYAFFKYKMASH